MTFPKRKKYVACVLLAMGIVDAQAAGWDCQRREDGKEWVCTSGDGKPSKPSQPDEPATKPSLRLERPSPPVPAASSTEAKPPSKTLPTEARTQTKPSPPPVAAQPDTTSTASPPPETDEARPPLTPRQATPAPDADEATPVARPSMPTTLPQAAAPSRPIRPPVDTDEDESAEETPQPAQRAAPGKPPATAQKPAPQQPTATTTEAKPENAAPAPVAKTGWGCRPGADRSWDCALSGPDPRGEPHVVGQTGKAGESWAESGDMTREDEQRFSSILARMPANPWALSCGKNKYEWTISSDFLLSDADQILREKSPLEIRANQAELIHGEASNYQGRAELTRADQRLYANFVTHNSKSNVLNAQGEVVYREKGLSFASDSAFMKLNTSEGVLRNSQFIIETVPARGTARVAHIDSKTKSRYETATYTTCPPGNQDWLLHATNATIDKETGVGTAKHAWLEFKGVPFLYTPWMTFPVDDRRRSGLLAPYFGYSKINGFDFTLPYYFNLAPNYDLTLMPRVLEKRGELLRTDFRYLSSMGSGRLFLDILPWDRIEQKSRGQVGWVDKTRFNENIASQVDLHLVTDHRYIQELGNLLAINNTTFLRSWGQVNYNGGMFLGGGFSANLLVDYYQSLDPTVQSRDYPYRRLPQLILNYGREMFGTGLQFQTTADITRFDQPYKVSGERLNLRPRLFYPFRDAAGYITPSLVLQHTEYWLQNTQLTESNSFSRTAPIFSIDSGAYFDNEFSLFDSPMQQTLEPRLFYLFVPKVDQPYNYNYGVGVDGVLGYQGLNFDTNEYDFNFYQLFRENRFAGYDRLSDANNITPALTTRLISQASGLERLKLSVGKVFYLTDPKVELVPNGPQVTYKDNIVSEMASMLSEHWSVRGTGQWNPSYNRVDRGQVILQYNNFNNHLFNVSYRYRRDPFDGSVPPYPVNPFNPRTINQTDVSTRLPIGGGWFAIGRWQYDLANQVTVEAMAGVERETCCWRFSLIGLRYANGVLGPVTTNSTASTNNAVFFQFELKGLGRFGDQVDNLLMQNFSGYRTDYELPSAYP